MNNSLFSRLFDRGVKGEAKQLIIAIGNSNVSGIMNNSLFSRLFGRGVKGEANFRDIFMGSKVESKPIAPIDLFVLFAVLAIH